MDLTYISLLLQEFGFPENKVLKVRMVSVVLLCPLWPQELEALLPASHPCPLCPSLCVFKLTRKINNVETSWALGAIFHYIDSLSRQKSPAS